MNILEVPCKTWIVYDDSDFDDFITAHTNKAWSIQQSLLECDNQAGNGVVNDFEAYYEDNEVCNEEVAAVEAWLSRSCEEKYHFPGRYECEGVTTDQIMTWLVYKGLLPAGTYKIRNYW